MAFTPFLKAFSSSPVSASTSLRSSTSVNLAGTHSFASILLEQTVSIVIFVGIVAMLPALSTTLSVKGKVPPLDGVPEIAVFPGPEPAPKDSPGGSDPALMLQVNGGVHPSVCRSPELEACNCLPSGKSCGSPPLVILHAPYKADVPHRHSRSRNTRFQVAEMRWFMTILLDFACQRTLLPSTAGSKVGER